MINTDTLQSSAVCGRVIYRVVLLNILNISFYLSSFLDPVYAFALSLCACVCTCWAPDSVKPKHVLGYTARA